MKTAFVLPLLLALSFGIPALAQDATVPGDYATIQAAIDGATHGGDGRITIEVAAGTYNEDLLIFRDGVELIGAGPEATMIVGSGTIDVVAVIGAEVFEMSGFTVTGGGSFNGIDLGRSNLATIENCVSNGNQIGISISRTANTSVVGCDASNNGIGIVIKSGSDNVISMNTVNGNTEHGIVLARTDFNQVTSNTTNGNSGAGFGAVRSFLNTFSGNTADNNGDSGIRLRRSDNTILTGNISTNNAANGFRFRETSGSMIDGNTFSNNGAEGIRMKDSIADDFDMTQGGVQPPIGNNTVEGNVGGQLRNDD